MRTRHLLSALINRCSSSSSSSSSSYLLSRSASTNSAINRGIRRSPTTKERPDIEQRSSLFDSDGIESHSPRLDYPEESRDPIARFSPHSDSPEEASDYSNSNYSDSYPQYTSWRPFAKPNPRLDYIPPPLGSDWTPKPRRHIPKVDYDSEWIYGTSVVEAALKAKKRKMYKLYIYTSGNRTSESRLRDRAMSGLAVDAGVEVVEEGDGGLLDSMSNSRPHNVCSSRHESLHSYSNRITSPLILQSIGLRPRMSPASQNTHLGSRCRGNEQGFLLDSTCSTPPYHGQTNRTK